MKYHTSSAKYFRQGRVSNARSPPRVTHAEATPLIYIGPGSRGIIFCTGVYAYTYKAQGWVGAILESAGTRSLGFLSSSVRSSDRWARSIQCSLFIISQRRFSTMPRYSITLFRLTWLCSPRSSRIGELSQRIVWKRVSTPTRSLLITSLHCNRYVL